MAINSRTKGHSFEREVAKFMNTTFAWAITKDSYRFRRVPLSGGFEKDIFPGDLVTLNRDLDNALHISLECKFYKDWKLEDLINGNVSMIYKWYAQAATDASVSGKTPIVIFKKNRSKIYIMAPSLYLTSISSQLPLMRIHNTKAILGEIETYMKHEFGDKAQTHMETAKINLATYGLAIALFEPVMTTLSQLVKEESKHEYTKELCNKDQEESSANVRASED